MRRAPLLLLLALTACRSGKDVPTADPVEAAPAQPADAAKPPVDLLHFTTASIAVSSNVDNPRDLPDHIADGKPETAWNGRTGDLVGGWIKVVIPPEAFVETIELSAGFDKVNSEGDLFTMNHRIKRVRVTRDGKLVREHTLDPLKRTPQPIPINASGGTFKIEVLETLAGTKKEWRELCVSELRVMGQANAAWLAAPKDPVVAVALFPHEMQTVIDAAEGELDKVLGKPFPTIDAFCKAWDAKVDTLLEARRGSGESHVPKDHRCKASGPLFAAFVPSADIKSVTKVTTYNVNWSDERFAIETPAGFVVVKESLGGKNYLDPGCFGHSTQTVDSVSATGQSLAIALTESWVNNRTMWDVNNQPVTINQDDSGKVHLDCAPNAAGKTTCTRTVSSRVCHSGGSIVPCNSF